MAISTEDLKKIIYRILFLIQRLDVAIKELHELEAEIIKFLPADYKNNPKKKPEKEIFKF